MKAHAKPILILTLLGALIAFAREVVTDYDHSTDFSQYRTYSFIHVKAPGLWEGRITRAVDAQLVEKGWSKVDAGGDAGVTVFGATREQPTLNTFYESFGGGWFWRGFGGTATTTVQETPIGTVVVDIFDEHNFKLVWRGVAQDALSGKPEKDEKKLNKSVAEMFKHFPPPPRL
jgi:hypothetical protein